MAKMNFGGVIEEVMTREEFPLEKAREVLKNETIAVLGYGVQGPGQACNLRDNGFNVIVGQRQGKTYDKAVADGWKPGVYGRVRRGGAGGFRHRPGRALRRPGGRRRPHPAAGPAGPV